MFLQFKILLLLVGFSRVLHQNMITHHRFRLEESFTVVMLIRLAAKVHRHSISNWAGAGLNQPVLEAIAVR